MLKAILLVEWDIEETPEWLMQIDLPVYELPILIDSLQLFSDVTRSITIFGSEIDESGTSSMDFTYIMEFKK